MRQILTCGAMLMWRAWHERALDWRRAVLVRCPSPHKLYVGCISVSTGRGRDRTPAETRRAAIATARSEHNHSEAGGDPGVCLSNSCQIHATAQISDPIQTRNGKRQCIVGRTDGWEERRFRIWPLRITVDDRKG